MANIKIRKTNKRKVVAAKNRELGIKKDKKVKKEKKKKRWGIIFLFLVIILVLLSAAIYAFCSYKYSFWPFENKKTKEIKVEIKKEVPIDAAKLFWDKTQVISDEKIFDDDANKKLTDNAWAEDSLRFNFLFADNSLPDQDGGKPWKGKYYNLETKSNVDLADFFYKASDGDLKWLDRSGLAMFNNERKLIKSNFNAEDWKTYELDGAISYDVSLDGKKLLLIKNDGEVLIKNLDDNSVKSLGKEIGFINPRWSPDGKLIAMYKTSGSKDYYDIGYIAATASGLSEFKKISEAFVGDGLNNDIVWSLNNKFLLAMPSNNVYSVEPVKALIVNNTSASAKLKSKLSPTSDKILILEKINNNDNSAISLSTMNLDGTKKIELLRAEGKWADLQNIKGVWTSDGERIIYIKNKKIWIVGSDGTNARQLSKEDKDYSDLQISFDGKKIVYLENNKVWLMSLGTEEIVAKPTEEKSDISVKSDEQLTRTGEEEYLRGATFSPDGKYILYEQFSKAAEGLGEPQVFNYVYNLETKEFKKISPEIYSLSDSFRTRWVDDNLIAYNNSDNGEVKVFWTDRDGNIKEEAKINNKDKSGLAWDLSLDGLDIVKTDASNRIYWREKGMADAKVIYEDDPKTNISLLRWSPDKKYILVLKGEKEVWALKVEDHKVVENKRLGENMIYGRDGGFDVATMVSWSPDSSKVVTQDSGNVFEIGNGLLAEGLLPYYSIKYGVTPIAFDYSWSPDSQFVAYRQNNNLYRIKPDGSDKKTLAESEIYCFDWAKDSGKIFFADGKGISVVNNDGSNNQRILNKEGKYSYIKVSSDGKKVVYVFNGDVYKVEL